MSYLAERAKADATISAAWGIIDAEREGHKTIENGLRQRIAELEAALREAREALRWVVDQAGGPACEHEAAVCFCKENAAINTANELLKD